MDAQRNLAAEEIILWLPKRYRALLARCPQNPKYHGEGNVLNHTALVVETCLKILPELSLTDSEVRILKWACLLHDIGKPSVTRYEQGRWTSRGHEAAGVPIARHILLSHAPELTIDERQAVCQIVKWHYAPFRWMKANRPFNLMEALHTSCDIKLLGIFAQIDFQGRICNDWVENQNVLIEFNLNIVPRVVETLGSFTSFQDSFKKKSPSEKNYVGYLLDQRNLQKINSIPERTLELPENDPKTIYLPIATRFSDRQAVFEKQLGLGQLYTPDFRKNPPGDELIRFKRWCELHPARMLGLNYPLWHRPTAKFITRMLTESGFTVIHVFWDETWENLLSQNQNLTDESLRQEAWIQHLSLQYFHPWLAHETIFVSYNQ